ncbi:hypothetical protein BDE40_1612 [Litoreibacter halocynthiae]|uniref:Uncharacterized protein n=1 Tax=Litoreibacter halocynthiae TaxID=1242689 RepID=A0A4R7LGN5_9RHOB|nr:hypothetical protein BDE40_1612 [Litoreibacter halocynthiae]
MCQYAIAQFKALGLKIRNGSNLPFEKYFDELDLGLGVVLTNKNGKRRHAWILEKDFKHSERHVVCHSVNLPIVQA